MLDLFFFLMGRTGLNLHNISWWNSATFPRYWTFSALVANNLTIWTSSHHKHVKYAIMELSPSSPVHRMIIFFSGSVSGFFQSVMWHEKHLETLSSPRSESAGWVLFESTRGRLSMNYWCCRRQRIGECVYVCVWRVCAYFKIHFSVGSRPISCWVSFWWVSGNRRKHEISRLKRADPRSEFLIFL